MTRSIYIVAFAICTVAPTSGAWSQEKSVNPGINDSFRDPDVKEFIARFEVESRELFARRHEIVAACQIKPGQTVADIGAGTGQFTRLFSDAVGKDGRIIAVEISQKFLDHIQATSREAGQRNVDTLLATVLKQIDSPASMGEAGPVRDTGKSSRGGARESRVKREPELGER